MPMQKPEMAATELRRCVVDLGLSGVQIGTHINDWNLDAPELYPVWEVSFRFKITNVRLFIIIFRKLRG